jgi:hypothetical protein
MAGTEPEAVEQFHGNHPPVGGAQEAGGTLGEQPRSSVRYDESPFAWCSLWCSQKSAFGNHVFRHLSLSVIVTGIECEDGESSAQMRKVQVASAEIGFGDPAGIEGMRVPAAGNTLVVFEPADAAGDLGL